jgi:hypothetical protein
MRDIPVFATELGVASLLLKDIPRNATAYINIRSSMNIDQFLNECIDFCKAAGASYIYASGDDFLKKFPHKADVYLMRRDNFALNDTALLFPVQEHTLKHWLEIYNRAMTGVSIASYMSYQDGLALLKEHSAYYVHQQECLLGIGIVSGDKVLAVASCEKGKGEIVLKALCSALDSETVWLEVASDNLRALRLYERLGFIRVGITESWYLVFG